MEFFCRHFKMGKINKWKNNYWFIVNITACSHYFFLFGKFLKQLRQKIFPGKLVKKKRGGGKLSCIQLFIYVSVEYGAPDFFSFLFYWSYFLYWVLTCNKLFNPGLLKNFFKKSKSLWSASTISPISSKLLFSLWIATVN